MTQIVQTQNVTWERLAPFQAPTMGKVNQIYVQALTTEQASKVGASELSFILIFLSHLPYGILSVESYRVGCPKSSDTLNLLQVSNSLIWCFRSTFPFNMPNIHESRTPWKVAGGCWGLNLGTFTPKWDARKIKYAQKSHSHLIIGVDHPFWLKGYS